MNITTGSRFLKALFDQRREAYPKVPPASTAPRPPVRRGIYILPALFTIGNMGLGFYSMVKSVSFEFGTAATAILLGHVLDIMDGTVARLTHTTSRFGVELDSLADWLTFSIAPSFLMYQLVLKDNKSWGFAIALLFVICGALRLARFNLKAHMGEGPSSFFVGLPTPAAGGMLAIFALLYNGLELGKQIRSFKFLMNQVPLFYEVVPAVMLLLSLLMVSDIRYAKFKASNLLRPRSLRALVLSVLAVLMIWVYPQNVIFILYASYVVWGIINYFFGRPLRSDTSPLAKDDPLDSYGK